MELGFLQEIVSLFGLAIIVVLISHKFKIPTIVGFLFTGLLCGPSALGIVANHEAVDIMAEVGVALLLFTIGMELSAKELLRMRRFLIFGGGGQVFITVILVASAFSFFVGINHAIVYGCLVALSSTAIVLSIFQKNAQTESPQGRACLGVLIFQDLIIVPMMLLFPLLVGDLEMSFQQTLVSVSKNVAVIAGIFLFGKFILPRLMLSVVRTRSREIMLMTTLGLCLAVALLTAHVGLSLSLGAFLAGLLLAESEYSLNAMENVLPFKDIFTSIFFISVGMLLNLDFFLTHILPISAIAAIIVVAKIAVIIPVVYFAGLSFRTAIITALSLAQIGEFSFVLAKSAMSLNLLDDIAYQTFLAASILTMVLTPVFISKAPSIASAFIKRFVKGANPNPEIQVEHSSITGHIVIVGFGVGGKNLAQVAKASDIPYLISEMNPDTVKRFRKTEPIRHGDASYPIVLEHLGVATARVLAIMVPDPVGARAIISNARRINPNIHIIVRARFLSEMVTLKEQGANEVIPEEFETSVEIFARVLNYYLVPRQEIEKQILQIREENYTPVRDVSLVDPLPQEDNDSAKEVFLKTHSIQTAPVQKEEVLEEITPETTLNNSPESMVAQMGKNLPNLQFASYIVDKNSPIEGQKLGDGTLRQKYRVSLAGIRRGDENIVDLNPETQFFAADILYLFGSQEAMIDVQELFTEKD